MAKMKWNLLLLLFIFCLISCVTTRREIKKLEKIEKIDEYSISADENEIYGYIIASILQNNPKRIEVTKNDDEIVKNEINTNILIINDYTEIALSSDKTYKENMQRTEQFIIREKGDVYNNCISNFSINNRSSYSLVYLIDNSASLMRNSKAEASLPPSQKQFDYWSRFYSTIPNACGKLAVSRIGYNDDHSAAIVEVKFLKESMNGFIDFLFFKKTNDQWEIQDSLRKRTY